MATTDVHHDISESRFEIKVDGTRAGVLRYQLDGTVYDLQHTDVDPEFEGHGIGTQLVLGALREIEELGGSIIPTCPFIPHVISQHPEFAPLVTGTDRARLGLS